MKNSRLFSVFALCAAVLLVSCDKEPVETVPSDIFSAITDPVFKAYCELFDTDEDGTLSQKEAEAVEKIDFYSTEITEVESLAGIEYFTGLKTLNCYNNQLTELDVSKNTQLTTFYCGYNQLTTLDVSKNKLLTHFSCFVNQLTELDVSKNTQLTFLSCSDNQLTTLDVNSNTQLIEFYCDANQLEELDVSKNTKLKYLGCNVNPKLTKIFVWGDFDLDNPTNSISNIWKDDQAAFVKK